MVTPTPHSFMQVRGFSENSLPMGKGHIAVVLQRCVDPVVDTSLGWYRCKATKDIYPFWSKKVEVCERHRT